MKTLEVVFTGKDRVEVRPAEVAAPGAGEVLVEATRTLISAGTEGIVLSRRFDAGTHYDAWVKYPFHPGYSLVGRVAAVGPGVEGVREGDRVGARAPHRGHALVRSERLYPIPDGVTDEDATWFGISNIVQNGVRRAEHELGDAVVVIGLGMLGQLVVQYARLLGARAVVAVDLSERRLELARAGGATHALCADAAAARDAVDALTGGRGADVVYDVTGFAPVFSAALGMLRRFGTLLLLGDTGSPGEQRLAPELVLKGLRVIGAHDSNRPSERNEHVFWGHHAMADLFFTLLERGQMRVGGLVSHRFAPHEAPEAYRVLREERAAAMGVVFDWTAL
jgi:2-desacetyl-2-hydroxyethyl bacteriochlorophyllide A dehydrogenase